MRTPAAVPLVFLLCAGCGAAPDGAATSTSGWTAAEGTAGSAAGPRPVPDITADALPASAPAPDVTGVSGTGFDSGRAWEHLVRQVAFGPRPAGSAALEAARRYIIAELQAARIGTRQQAFFAQTPAGEIPMINVIATIAGRRPERIVIGSHFDTKRAPFRFVGANDGASSTAALLEIGRVLAAGERPEYTIELLFLDGEEAVNWDWGVTGEDNTYGSRHYVDEARRSNTLDDIVAFVLLDMVGERDLRILRDTNSTPWLVDIIWAAARRLGHESVFADGTTRVEDDHISFLRAGVPSVDIIDLEYPEWHTAQDDVDRLSARSLQIVGDVVLTALPDIQTYVASRRR